jgi:hypothetical protein
VKDVLANGILQDFNFFEWIAGGLPDITLSMATRANSEMAMDICNRLSVDYSKALTSTRSPDVRFWISVACGHFDLHVSAEALKISGSSSVEEALREAVAKSLGIVSNSLNDSPKLDPNTSICSSEILALSERHIRRVRSLIKSEVTVNPLFLSTLHPLKGLETLPRETNASTINNFVSRLAEAFSIIKNVYPGFSAEIGYLIDHIVPLKCDSSAIYSGSSSLLPGVVFMAANVEDPGLVAEMAIHEAMHTKLFLLQRWDPLFESNDDIYWRGCKAYSPWRECHRPVQGVLHGAFVFTAVSKFWSVLSDTNDDVAARRAATSSSESLLAIDQVLMTSALTDWGTRLIKALQQLNYSILGNYPNAEQMIGWSPERSIKGSSRTISDSIRLHLDRCNNAGS